MKKGIGKKGLINDTQDAALSILPNLSGILTPEIISNPEAVLVRIGTGILGNKLQKFYEEFREKRENGEVREDVESIQDSLYETLEFIKQNPKEENLEALKKLFFKSISPNTPEAEQILVFELLQLSKKLTTNDLLVLKAAYEAHFDQKLSNEQKQSRLRSAWFKTVAKKLGHDVPSLIESSEEHLMTLKLISPIDSADSSVFRPLNNYRLTDLGFALCKYLKE